MHPQKEAALDDLLKRFEMMTSKPLMGSDESAAQDMNESGDMGEHSPQSGFDMASAKQHPAEGTVEEESTEAPEHEMEEDMESMESGKMPIEHLLKKMGREPAKPMKVMEVGMVAAKPAHGAGMFESKKKKF